MNAPHAPLRALSDPPTSPGRTHGLPASPRIFAVVKRSVIINGHKTSVSLEDAFWDGLKDIARRQSISLSALIEAIEGRRSTANLSSAIRLFVFGYFRSRAITEAMIGMRRETDDAKPPDLHPAPSHV